MGKKPVFGEDLFIETPGGVVRLTSDAKDYAQKYRLYYGDPKLKRLDYVPKGFRLAKGATTAPVGYRLYTDRKGTRFTPKNARYVLVKDKRRNP